MRPAVKAHISVILGLLALVKAVGYYLARFNLDLSRTATSRAPTTPTSTPGCRPSNYSSWCRWPPPSSSSTTSAARVGPCPILGVGLWFLVALTAGTIYPAAVQALKVNPAQNTLERPYIQRNIDATRAAMGINNVK